MDGTASVAASLEVVNAMDAHDLPGHEPVDTAGRSRVPWLVGVIAAVVFAVAPFVAFGIERPVVAVPVDCDDVTPLPDLEYSPALDAVLELGDQGGVITELQNELFDLNFFDEAFGDAVDGDFGPCTREAVRRFQAGNGLSVTGVADELTRDVLRSGFAERAVGSTSAEPEPELYFRF